MSRARLGWALVAVLLGYFVLAAGYALATPRWNNPDEPAHFNYLAQVARTGALPALRPGDWDAERLGQRLESGRFVGAEPIDELRYEGHQPPLYYLLLAPPFWLTEGLGNNARIVALRGVSILLGGFTVVAIFAAARTLVPRRPELAPLAAGLVAFVPMFTAMSAAINNDALATLLASLTLLVVLRGLRDGFGTGGALLIGLLSGALLLTKLTVYPLVPLSYLALVLDGAGSSRPRRLERSARYVTLALLVTALLAGWWFFRNLTVYGPGDPFGLRRHDLVVVGQPRWPGLGENLESLRFFGLSMFRSFWAQFGWMAVVLDARFYALYLLFLGLAAGGLRRFWRVELPDWPPAAALGLKFLLAALGLIVAEVVVYNLSFIQAQGRYLHPALLPIGMLLGLGWIALADVGPRLSTWRRVGFGLGFFLVWALAIESLAWLIGQGPAPVWLHLVTAGQAWLATRFQQRRERGSVAGVACVALLIALFLADAAALLRFVVPYFQGW
jgi:4-amino-4-deoxy-L-arabinose transferase-like glycosyltransferase